MVTAAADHRQQRLTTARAAAGRVTDPELPMLTLADLGVLRGVEVTEDGTVVASVTPTYSGCPAMDAMRADLASALRAAGFPRVRIRTVLQPAWSTDDISPRGRRLLAEHGLSPPGPAPVTPAPGEPVPLTLRPVRRAVRCPECAEPARVTSEFGPTPCTALYRCEQCGEQFQHVKER